MPDVKWYAGGATVITISTTAVSGGTNNRLLRQTGSVVGNSLLSDDGTDVTLASGVLGLPNGTSAAPSHTFSGLTTMGLSRTGNTMNLSAAGAFAFYNGTALNTFFGANNNGDVSSASGGHFAWSSGGDASASLDTSIKRHAAQSVRFANAGTGTASVVLGTSSHPATPASTYLFIEGVSGAGGTPTTSHLTAGSGVSIYTQDAHDAAATKFVVAYNLGGSMRYLVFTLDGTTTVFTNSATRP